MIFFETHRRSIRGVSLVVMIMYLVIVVLSIKFTIAKRICAVMLFLAVIATIMQIITCVKKLASESNCNGNNGVMQGLLLWVVIFVVTLTMF